MGRRKQTEGAEVRLNACQQCHGHIYRQLRTQFGKGEYYEAISAFRAKKYCCVACQHKAAKKRAQTENIGSEMMDLFILGKI